MMSIIEEYGNFENLPIEHKIGILKCKLAETDYKAIKYAEGELLEEEYAETKAQRKEWRKEINKLEEELKDDSNSI